MLWFLAATWNRSQSITALRFQIGSFTYQAAIPSLCPRTVDTSIHPSLVFFFLSFFLCCLFLLSSFLCCIENVGTNPGLLALWEDERKRLAERGLSESLIDAPESQGVQPTISLLLYAERPLI